MVKPLTERIVATLVRHGMDGVVATNTTVGRDAVKGLPHAQEAGGLSGAPVFDASNRVIAQLRSALGPRFPIIGVTACGASRQECLDAGMDGFIAKPLSLACMEEQLRAVPH